MHCSMCLHNEYVHIYVITKKVVLCKIIKLVNGKLFHYIGHIVHVNNNAFAIFFIIRCISCYNIYMFSFTIHYLLLVPFKYQLLFIIKCMCHVILMYILFFYIMFVKTYFYIVICISYVRNL